MAGLITIGPATMNRPFAHPSWGLWVMEGSNLRRLNTALFGALFSEVLGVGHPMSPGSVGGVHRRHVRRNVRKCSADGSTNRDGIDCNCTLGMVCY